nr:hypothetical protein [Tanacetum cinerariifolium]
MKMRNFGDIDYLSTLTLGESGFFGFGKRSRTNEEKEECLCFTVGTSSLTDKKAEVTTVPSGTPIATTTPYDVVKKDVIIIAVNIHDASAKGDNGVNNADVIGLKFRVDTTPDVVKTTNSTILIMLKSLWLVGDVMKEVPSSYANKLSLTSLTKANLRKLKANVPNDADYNVWLPLVSVHKYMRDILVTLLMIIQKLLLKEWGIEWIKARARFRGQILGADDECFIKVKRGKLGGINGGNKHFKSVLVKPKTQYRPKAKQSTVEIASPVGTNKASNKESPKNKVRLLPLVRNRRAMICPSSRKDVIEKHILEGKLVLVDDDGEPMENVDYLANLDNDEEVEPIKNENASF